MIPRFHRAVHSVPFAVDNKQTSWVALPDPKAQRLTAGKYRPLLEVALAVEGGCGTSFATSHTRVYEKTPRNRVVEKPAKRAILDAEFSRLLVI
jgi:hypothetical protein